jgi:hypothetical protein
MCRECQNLRISPRENTQHNMIEQVKSSVCVFGKESKKLESEHGIYSSRRHAVR